MATLKRNGADNSRQESTAGTTKVHVERLEGAGGGGGGRRWWGIRGSF